MRAPASHHCSKGAKPPGRGGLGVQRAGALGLGRLAALRHANLHALPVCQIARLAETNKAARPRRQATQRRGTPTRAEGPPLRGHRAAHAPEHSRRTLPTCRSTRSNAQHVTTAARHPASAVLPPASPSPSLRSAALQDTVVAKAFGRVPRSGKWAVVAALSDLSLRVAGPRPRVAAPRRSAAASTRAQRGPAPPATPAERAPVSRGKGARLAQLQPPVAARFGRRGHCVGKAALIAEPRLTTP